MLAQTMMTAIDPVDGLNIRNIFLQSPFINRLTMQCDFGNFIRHGLKRCPEVRALPSRDSDKRLWLPPAGGCGCQGIGALS